MLKEVDSTARGTDANGGYLPGIDSLRAVAVLSVVLYHLKRAWCPGGFTGVDIFFVISGYVISKSLATRASNNFRSFLLAFYKRRIIRIVPALLVCLVIVSVASELFIPDGWLSDLNKWTAVSAFFGVSNFYLVASSDGYFSQRIAFNPFVHTWSLGVEEQFYLLFPLIFWLRRNVRDAGRWTRAICIALLPGLAIASLALATILTKLAPMQAFYLLPSRFWELAVGALLFDAKTESGFGLWHRPRPALLVFCGTALISIGFAYSDADHFPFPWVLPPVFGSALIIAGITQLTMRGSRLGALINFAPMTYVGRLSYSMYLWHWPIFTLFRWTIGLTNSIEMAAALSLTFCISILSYHFVESAIRRSGRVRAAQAQKIVTVGMASMAFGCLLTALSFKYPAVFGLTRSVTTNQEDWNPHFIPHHVPPLNSGTQIGNGKRLFVIGDSHADAYTAMVTLAATSLGAEPIIFAAPGCPLWNLMAPQKKTGECVAIEQAAISLLRRRASPGDIVFLASLRVRRLGDQYQLYNEAEVLSKASLPEDVLARRDALAQAAGFIDELRAQGLLVLMDAPMPVFRAPPLRCSDWFNRRNPICSPGFAVSRDLIVELRKPTMGSLKVLHESHGIYVWDPLPVLCSGATCSAFDGARPKMLDGDHLSGYGNQLLVSSFTEELSRIWGHTSASTYQ